MVPYLPHVNALLNGLATVLLVVGFVLIKQRQEQAHKVTMLSCFGVSVVFLVSYLTRIVFAGTHLFPRDEYPTAALFYYPLLASHVFLAAGVPFLAIATIYFGLTDQRRRHVRFARWTFPIWLYVSITGVIVYLMLYQLFPETGLLPKIK
ncbi:DUF420 domain-containing protein [Anatilimnocola aggregata]|uniref:DUF420 domain-containing protein n=1 Tax=Anatilimnocola aggregata TaxID=2528021 RepID=UPI001EE421D1|nr:DUF420 domain-containing protein [Anatilimnocola aggregata]